LDVYNDRTTWKRNVYTAIVAADGKPCLVVYFKKFDEDDGQVKQKMTMFLPKSCEGIEFPVQDLTGFFSMLADVKGDIESGLDVEELKPLRWFF